MGLVRFGVPEQMVLWARDTVDAKAFVETGTNRAVTTAWASQHFERVVTIEGQEDLHRAAIKAYGDRGNIKFLHGDSRHLLGPVLADLNQSAILWLDAHWCGDGTFGPTAECPLMEELNWVNKSPHDHVILIDDARLFVAPPPAPHREDHWPDLLSVCQSLSAGDRPRYAAVFEDVIIAIPKAWRASLVNWIRSRPPLVSPSPASGFKSIARRLLGRS